MWDDTYADRAIETLQDLVAIPSHVTEKDVAMYIGRRLRSKGLDVTLTDVTSGRPNLIARLSHAPARSSVMLQAHLDTVPPTDTMAGFRIVGNRLFGRGACDARAAMAGMLVAIECLAESTQRPPLDVLFVGNMGEETGSVGSRVLVDSGFTVDGGIVGEPTDNVIVIAHKGLVWLEISVRLVDDVPFRLLRNADPAFVLARVIETLDHAFLRGIAADSHPNLGSRTLNIGTVSMRPMGPSLCRVRADVRLLPGDDPATVVDFARASLTDVEARLDHYRIEVNPYRTYPPLDIRRDSDLVRSLARAAAAVTGDFQVGVAPYCSDGGVFNTAQIPVVLFGPGKIDQAHADEEFVDISQTRTAAQIYYQFLLEFARIAS